MDELKTRYPAITACRLAVEAMPSGEAEAHVDILLPQHQIIFNEVAADADAARAKALALEHSAELQARIADMQAMQRALQSLARDCHGDQRPECPILDDLAGTPPPH